MPDRPALKQLVWGTMPDGYRRRRGRVVKVWTDPDDPSRWTATFAEEATGHLFAFGERDQWGPAMAREDLAAGAAGGGRVGHGMERPGRGQPGLRPGAADLPRLPRGRYRAAPGRREEPAMTIEEFAEMILEQQREESRRGGYPDWMTDALRVKVVPGRVYTKVDVGPEHNMSGRYMVEVTTGRIYGIKGYGKVHKGHYYGTLEEAAERWNWGGYRARRRAAG